ncbi:hypothetical protein PCASD_10162 [Puccinia coronata f. sp. avenae]|uniref:Uncharacterized protein n=1 Tax=Puccinia coronata f. sp. avenae TaxID=200324 RepID=A0A2N5UGN6_9BASI|nr:hypothetical protein PCASD_10162 [Puccinia coronata f. sp. avenae]
MAFPAHPTPQSHPPPTDNPSNRRPPPKKTLFHLPSAKKPLVQKASEQTAVSFSRRLFSDDWVNLNSYTSYNHTSNTTRVEGLSPSPDSSRDAQSRIGAEIEK